MALELFNSLTPIYVDIVAALMILLIGFMAGKLLGVILNRLFVEVQLDKAVKIFSGINLSFSKFLSETITIAIYVVSFIMALNKLGIINIVLKITLIITLVVIAGSIIIAIFGFMPNLYGGIMIKSNKKYVVGDKVKIKTAKGKVTKIKTFKTFLETEEGDLIVIRNWTAFKEAKKIIHKKKVSK